VAAKFRDDVRNIAIIAHVDHGKTTLVDGLLDLAGAFRRGEVLVECALDSNPLERERGITILAKCTAITWKGVRINIVDTPGHADFAGEVERVLRMVDSVVLLVDAAEGPMPQTRFVTRKALELGLRPIVVINKVDRKDADPNKAHEDVFNLFVALEAEEEQLDFPMLFASGREKWATYRLEDERVDLGPLLDEVLRHVPPPPGEVDAPLAMQVATLDYDDYLGYIAVGRVQTGKLAPGERILLARPDGHREEFRVTKILGFQGLRRFELAGGAAGEVVAVTGMSDLKVGDILTSIESPASLPAMVIDEPTIAMNFMANTSPFVGQEGSYVTSRHLRERLWRELRSNVALRVEATDSADTFRVSGRGELHLGVLIETMRREGFELMISPPRVIFHGEGASRTEPYEEVVIDVDEQYVGPVIEEMGRRGGRMEQMLPAGLGRTRLEYVVPARGLIGYRSEFLSATRGTGVMHRCFREYGTYIGPIKGRQNGVLVVMEEGVSNAYALFNLQDRASLFIGNGERVYVGQIVGLNARDSDMLVNPNKTKKLTNIRTHAHDEMLRLTPPWRPTLEQAMAFINDDELVEVTPKSIRLRKRILDASARKRAEMAENKATALEE
jgi:GTP-binding protein